MGVVAHKYVGRYEIHSSESTAFRWDREVLLMLYRQVIRVKCSGGTVGA